MNKTKALDYLALIIFTSFVTFVLGLFLWLTIDSLAGLTAEQWQSGLTYVGGFGLFWLVGWSFFRVANRHDWGEDE
jgi:high-affinity Fe2+/Pb2+ permease